MSEVILTDQVASSINATWPPTPASDNRLRGFYTEQVLDSSETVAVFADEFRDYQEMAANRGSDRLSIRAVASLGAIALLERTDITIEGALPFERNGEELFLAYMGWNAAGRAVSDADYRVHRHLLDAVHQHRRSAATSSDNLEDEGYSMHLIDSSVSSEERARVAPRFTEAYAVFGYDREETEAVVESHTNTIGYIEHQGRIASTAMAEAGAVEVGGIGPIHLVEVTEAYTHPEYRGRGLYRAISGVVLRAVLNEREQSVREVDVLYGESNLAMPGVLHAAQENGRRFGYLDAERLGVSGHSFGILPQNVAVRDGVENRPYNDFALSYVPLYREVI